MRSVFSYLCPRHSIACISRRVHLQLCCHFHKFYFVLPEGKYFKQIISKQIKRIDNVLIPSFSLSNQFGCQHKKMFLKLILVANMSFNGLTRSLKTVRNKRKPSLEVTQKLKRWGISLQLNSSIELSFILHLNKNKNKKYLDAWCPKKHAYTHWPQ